MEDPPAHEPGPDRDVARPTGRTVGLLLAAGRGTRFDGSGRLDKLMARVDGVPVVVHACRNLSTSLEHVLAVVRDDEHGRRVADALRDEGCEVLVCPDAALGMGHSLAFGAAHLRERGAVKVLVALGDMPFVRPATISAVAEAVRSTTDIVTPFHEGRRGHPVGFGAAHLDRLARLAGDRGAGRLLEDGPIIRLDTDDAGVLLDIDRPADLEMPRD